MTATNGAKSEPDRRTLRARIQWGASAYAEGYGATRGPRFLASGPATWSAIAASHRGPAEGVQGVRRRSAEGAGPEARLIKTQAGSLRIFTTERSVERQRW